MDVTHDRRASLPIRHTLTPAYAASVVVAVLLVVTSLTGLVYRSIVYPTDELVRAFVPNDVVTLLVGLPLLIGSIVLAWRRHLMGLLAWPGALIFILYTYVAYVIAVPLGLATLAYAALVLASGYALVRLVAAIDGKSVQTSLAGRVSERITGVILAGLGALFFLRSGGVLANAALGGAAISQTDLAVNLSDFLVSPAWVIGGVLLWRRKELGYVLGLGLLVGLSLLFIALVVLMLLQPALTAAPFVLIDVVVVLAMGSVCFVPCVLFARGTALSRAGSPG